MCAISIPNQSLHCVRFPWEISGNQSNSKLERPHANLVSCLSKVSKKTDWDKYIRPFCSAFNVSRNATTKFSPYYTLFHREPILPIDTIMRPRDRYQGDDYLPAALEIMHRAYYLVRKRLKAQSLKSKLYYDLRNKVKPVKFEIGDPVFIKNYQRQDKLDALWLPHFRILTKTGEYSYIIQNQVTGKSRRIHAVDMRLAHEEEEWNHPNVFVKRAARNAVNDLSEVSDPSDSESEFEEENKSEDDFSESETTGGSQTKLKAPENVNTNPTDTDTDKETRPTPRLPRVTKSKALDKLKLMRQVTKEPPLQHQIQQEVQSALTSFMHSFTSALNQSLPSSVPQ